MPQAPQKVNCAVCSSSPVIDAPPTSSVQTSRQGRFHTLSPGWSPSEKTSPGLQCCHQHPLMLVGQSLGAHSRPQHFAMVQHTANSSSCTLQWNVHCLGRPVVCHGKVIQLLLFSRQKESLFVQLCTWPAAGQPSAYWWCWVSVTCHRPHIGCQFCCCRL